jgi:hypothetical protein
MASLAKVPWFQNVGRPSQWDKDVVRIWDWSDWPGPENPGVFSLGGERFQAWRDALFDKHKTKRDELTLSTVWKETHDLVMKVAIPKVSLFSFDEDAWHAPTQSVWSAAWAASVINCYLTYHKSVPEELERIWQWYVRGHWPCGYTKAPVEDAPGELLVF